MTQHSFLSSFSVVSTPIVASEYSFLSMSEDIEHFQICAQFESQNFGKVRNVVRDFEGDLSTFEMFENCFKILIDLEKFPSKF